jgi:hypothetical protein
MLKKHQQKYVEMHRALPDKHTSLVCFFEQFQNPNCTHGVLNQLKKDKNKKASKKSSTIKRKCIAWTQASPQAMIL